MKRIIVQLTQEEWQERAKRHAEKCQELANRQEELKVYNKEEREKIKEIKEEEARLRQVVRSGQEEQEIGEQGVLFEIKPKKGEDKN